ncbi:hypothetical protein C7212DRAFT_319167, partial [Tuber magnatum]
PAARSMHVMKCHHHHGYHYDEGRQVRVPVLHRWAELWLFLVVCVGKGGYGCHVALVL